MARFETLPLKPDVPYPTYLGQMKFTAEDFRKIGRNTRKALRANKRMPVLLKHDDSKQGDPFDPQDVSALQCEGHLVDCKVNRNGHLRYIFETPDTSEVTERLRDGRIEFTSPSFGHYKDFDGNKERDWGVLTRHLALTPFPKNTDQPPIKELVNFSEALAGSPIAVYDTKIKPTRTIMDDQKVAQTTTTTPPKIEDVTKPQVDDNQLQELIVAAGLTAPSAQFSTDPVAWATQFISQLQSYVAKLASNPKTASNIAAALQPEAAGVLAYNFSEHSDPLVRKLYADYQETIKKNATVRNAAAQEALRQKVEQPWLPSDVRVALLNRIGSLNFSESADGTAVEEPSLTVSEVVDMVERSIPKNAKLGDEELVDAEHPEGDKFFSTKPPGENGQEDLTLAEADKIVDSFMKTSYFESKV